MNIDFGLGFVLGFLTALLGVTIGATIVIAIKSTPVSNSPALTPSPEQAASQ